MTSALRPFDGVTPTLGKRVYVDPAAVVIGTVELGDDVSIWPFVVVRGDVNSISIGEQTNIQDGSVLHVTHVGPYTPKGGPLQIGRCVTVGHGAILHACQIGDSSLIGMGATVLDGATVGEYAMIGAGALVSPGKVVPPATLWLGNPARQARELRKDEIEMLDYSAEHYVRLKNKYLSP